MYKTLHGIYKVLYIPLNVLYINQKGETWLVDGECPGTGQGTVKTTDAMRADYSHDVRKEQRSMAFSVAYYTTSNGSSRCEAM